MGDNEEANDAAGFDAFVVDVEPRLRRAFIGCRGADVAPDAVAEALAYAWEHWEHVRALDNPSGYLFRVGQSRTRRRRQGVLPAPTALRCAEVEPALIPALMSLSDRQRTAVWLVHGCDWSYAEVADAMHLSASAVGTHVARALAHLRDQLEVDTNV
ncbi:MAG: sigma-70 family RNA polymerase sigma factor [Acidimicrobiia bacterium]|nr:sigma-70 family RNA polymerase sigma factor [Acidimicrobiia bacterium]